MPTVLMTGGTGMVGRALSSALVQKGYKIIILTRKLTGRPCSENISYALWDIKKKEIDLQAVQEADYIIHLAGAGVMDKKWTVGYKKEILDSRIRSGQLILDTLKQHSNSVKAFISASAIGWYGTDRSNSHFADQQGFTEEENADPGFLGETCRQWEESLEPAALLGIRLVKFRIGIVLTNDGGALVEFKKPLKMGIAAILGNGKQIISWVHIEDLCRIFISAIENYQLKGSYNAVAPEPVTNKALILKLAITMRGGFYIPVHIPVFLLKLLVGQRSIEILKSVTVSCRKIKDTGFTFLYPSIEAAIDRLIRPSGRPSGNS